MGLWLVNYNIMLIINLGVRMMLLATHSNMVLWECLNACRNVSVGSKNPALDLLS